MRRRKSLGVDQWYQLAQTDEVFLSLRGSSDDIAGRSYHWDPNWRSGGGKRLAHRGEFLRRLGSF